MAACREKGAGAAAELEGRGAVRGDRDQTGGRLRFQGRAGSLGIPGKNVAPALAQGCLDKTSQGEVVRKQQRSNRHAVSWPSFYGVRQQIIAPSAKFLDPPQDVS